MPSVLLPILRVFNIPVHGSVIRLTGCLVLLAIGIPGTVSLVNFARLAAARETFGFSAHYTAARLAVLGETKGSLQDLNWFEAQTRRYGFKATDVFYGNPPSAALVMTPIALFPPTKARTVWIWTTLAFWGAGIAVLGLTCVRLAKGSAWMSLPALLCLAVLFAPAKANIEEGQVYIFVFFLQSLCCALWLRNLGLEAGIAGGLLLASKAYGLPLIVLALFRRDRRFLAGATGTFTLLVIVSGALLGFGQWLDFASTHARPEFSGIPTPALQTLKSFLSLALDLPTVARGPLRILVPGADLILFCALGLLFLGLLLWLSEVRFNEILSNRPVAPPSAAALSACVLINLVFSPRAEEHSYPLAMTAVLLSISLLRKLDLVAAFAILGAILLAWPFHLQDRSGTVGWDFMTDFARLWGAIILLGASLAAEYVRRRSSPRDQGPQSSGNWSFSKTPWAGAYAACVVAVLLTLWYVKPWRNPVRHGPLLAVSRTDADEVMLVRLDVEEREVANIPLAGCKGPFGLAFGLRRWLYAACWNESKVALIDLSRARRTTPFAAAKLPAWAMQREGTDEVWISNEAAAKVTIYRAGTSTIVGEVRTGQGPSDIAFSHGGTRAWISNEVSGEFNTTDVRRAGAGSVSLVDPVRRQKVRDIPVGSVPQGMSVTSNGDRLVVANFKSNTLSIIDTSRARELFEIPVCAGPVDVVTSKQGDVELAFVSCYSAGSVAVVDLDRKREIQRIAIGDKPFGIAASAPENARIYVCVGGSNRLVVLQAGRPSRILRRLRLDGNPLQLALAR